MNSFPLPFVAHRHSSSLHRLLLSSLDKLIPLYNKASSHSRNDTVSAMLVLVSIHEGLFTVATFVADLIEVEPWWLALILARAHSLSFTTVTYRRPKMPFSHFILRQNRASYKCSSSRHPFLSSSSLLLHFFIYTFGMSPPLTQLLSIIGL